MSDEIILGIVFECFGEFADDGGVGLNFYKAEVVIKIFFCEGTGG